MQNQKTDTKIELKWYEKKQGVKLSQKKKKVLQHLLFFVKHFENHQQRTKRHRL